ncbi:MAG TPA: YetF domain-containing protein [Fimbriimonadaceae bacterium]|nr:YetF domain-containing protein [Fimbriimonadaceae bacterium]
MNAQVEFLLSVALNTAVIYAFLIIAVRLVGRRHLGQLTALDMLILLLLGSAVETSMVRANTSLRAGLVSAAILLVLNKLLNLAMLRSRRFNHLVGAGPLLLVHDGKFVEENMKRLGMTKNEVIEAIRERECASIAELRYAVFEANGEINIVYRDQPVSEAESPGV